MSDTAIYLGPTLNREVAKSILKAEARGDFMCVLGGDKLYWVIEEVEILFGDFIPSFCLSYLY
jgi:hypothetical protein